MLRILVALLISTPVLAGDLIKVAVIDTGNDNPDTPLCPGESIDFTGTGIKDTRPHGTHISYLINKYAIGEEPLLNGRYCQIILKYYTETQSVNENVAESNQAFRYAIEHNANIINYSSSGYVPEQTEKTLIILALNKGIKIVTAAGNDGIELGGKFDRHSYPGHYSERILTVGNLGTNSVRAPSSNYGKEVNAWEIGTSVLGALPGNQFGYLTGTSQSTAIRTGKLIHEMLLKQQKETNDKANKN